MVWIDGTCLSHRSEFRIKELKEGIPSVVLKFEKGCDAFVEVGDRTVAFLSDLQVVVYAHGEVIGTCTRTCGNRYSVFVDDCKVHFASIEGDLVEWNVHTFEERVLLRNVHAMSGLPSEANFIAVSGPTNLLQTTQKQKDLKETFPHMNHLHWTAILSFKHFAVVTGSSSFSLANGLLEHWHNFFLLVDLATLEVANKDTVVSSKWVGTCTFSSSNAQILNPSSSCDALEGRDCT